MRLLRTDEYNGDVADIFTGEEQAVAESEIMADPLRWPVVRNSGGVRKARARRAGKGKSGGARIIYYVVSRRGVIYLMHAYAKSAKQNLTQADLKRFRELTSGFKEN